MTHLTTWTWTVPSSELNEVFHLLRSTATTDHGTTITLIADGSRRRWYVETARRKVRIAGGPTAWFGRIVLPTSLLAVLSKNEDRDVDATVIHVNGRDGIPVEIAIERDGLTVRCAAPRQSALDHDPLFHASQRQVVVTVPTSQLREVLRALPPASNDDETVSVVTAGGVLHVESKGPDGAMCVEVRGTGGGSSSFVTDRTGLADLFGDLHDDETIISFPDSFADRVFVESGPVALLVDPRGAREQHARRSIENAIRAAFGPRTLDRDDDGDYEINSELRDPIYARLAYTNPTALRLFARIVENIGCTPELLTELNDSNGSLLWTRLIYVGDSVHATIDLPANTLDVSTLVAGISRLVDAAQHVAPMISAVHGGHPAALRPCRVDRDAQSGGTAGW